MRGVELYEPGSIRVVDVPDPDPGPRGEALVRIHTVGVCGTDTSIVSGKIPVDLPRVIGHEGVGVVEASTEEIRPGAGALSRV